MLKAVDMRIVRLSNEVMRAAKASEQEPRQIDADPDIRNVSEAFFDGFTAAGLFTRVQQPGSPTRLFADEAPDARTVGNRGATGRLQSRALKSGAFGFSRRARNSRSQDSVVPDVRAASLPSEG